MSQHQLGLSDLDLLETSSTSTQDSYESHADDSPSPPSTASSRTELSTAPTSPRKVYSASSDPIKGSASGTNMSCITEPYYGKQEDTLDYLLEVNSTASFDAGKLRNRGTAPIVCLPGKDNDVDINYSIRPDVQCIVERLAVKSLPSTDFDLDGHEEDPHEFCIPKS